jgi:hypothetical protein
MRVRVWLLSRMCMVIVYYTHMHTFAHTPTHALPHIHILTHILTHTYTYSHTHTHSAWATSQRSITTSNFTIDANTKQDISHCTSALADTITGMCLCVCDVVLRVSECEKVLSRLCVYVYVMFSVSVHLL